ncbi:MAG TPA: hypothetical protein VIG64_13335 [Actinomycetota bacterium]|jgi:hypothetical protein
MSRAPGIGDAALEGALLDLAPHVAFPAERDLSMRVTAAIRTETVRRDAPRIRRRPARAFAFAGGLAMAALLGLALTPATRDAVADFLGIGGVRITAGGGAAPTPTASAGTNLALGELVTLEEARALVDFSILVPGASGFEEPDEVYVAGFPPGGRVSLVYDAGRSLPRADKTGVGLLITEFEGMLENTLVKKLAVQQQVRPTEVDGKLAYWVRGPHTLFYLDAEGELRQETLRLSDNALIWTSGSMTLRIESSLSLEDSLAIAESMDS